MNRYAIEHRSVAYGQRVHPLIAVLEEVSAYSALEVKAYVKNKYQLTTDTELIHVRRLA